MVKVHFLNVGHGDCTLIEHDSGRLTMIDINNGDDLDADSTGEVSEVLGLDPGQVGRTAKSWGLSCQRVLEHKGYTIPLTNPVAYLRSHYPGRSLFRYIQSHPHLDHMRGADGVAPCGY